MANKQLYSIFKNRAEVKKGRNIIQNKEYKYLARVSKSASANVHLHGQIL